MSQFIEQIAWGHFSGVTGTEFHFCAAVTENADWLDFFGGEQCSPLSLHLLLVDTR